MMRPPVRLVTQNRFTLYMYLISFAFTYFWFVLFVFSRLQSVMIWINVALTLVTLLFFSLSWGKDPGYIRKQIEFIQLLEVYDPAQLCPSCQIIRTPRSRHCIVCHRCVERFDHHCPWINNCVGIGNHNYFLGYLIS